MKIFKETYLPLATILLLSCYVVTPLNANPAVPAPTRADPLGIRDGGVVSEQPCGPPCYQGIEPGTSVEDAVSTINSLGWNGVCNINATNISCGPISSFIYFDTAKNAVKSINFDPFNVTVNDLTGKYGAPDWFNVDLDVDDVGQSTGYYFMMLYYDNLKMYVRLEFQNRQDTIYVLAPQTKVKTVYYEEVFWQDLHLHNDWHSYGDY